MSWISWKGPQVWRSFQVVQIHIGGGLNSRHLPETHTISNKRVLCTGFFILWGQLILGWGCISVWDGSPAKRRALGFPLGQEPKLWKILSDRIRIQTTVVFKFSYIHCKPCSASSTRAGPPYQKKYPGHSPSKPIIYSSRKSCLPRLAPAYHKRNCSRKITAFFIRFFSRLPEWFQKRWIH